MVFINVEGLLSRHILLVPAVMDTQEICQFLCHIEDTIVLSSHDIDLPFSLTFSWCFSSTGQHLSTIEAVGCNITVKSTFFAAGGGYWPTMAHKLRSASIRSMGIA